MDGDGSCVNNLYLLLLTRSGKMLVEVIYLPRPSFLSKECKAKAHNG